MPVIIAALVLLFLFVFIAGIVLYIAFWAAVAVAGLWLLGALFVGTAHAVSYVAGYPARRREARQAAARRRWQRQLRGMGPVEARRHAHGATSAGRELAEVGESALGLIGEAQQANAAAHTLLTELLGLSGERVSARSDARLQDVASRAVAVGEVRRALLAETAYHDRPLPAHPAFEQLARGPEWPLLARLPDLPHLPEAEARQELADVVALTRLTLARHQSTDDGDASGADPRRLQAAGPARSA